MFKVINIYSNTNSRDNEAAAVFINTFILIINANNVKKGLNLRLIKYFTTNNTI